MKERLRKTATYRTLKYYRIRSLRDEVFARYAQKYALRTLYTLIALVVLLVAANHFLPESFTDFLDPLTHDPTLMVTIFFASESILGLIPPDLFIIWAVKEPNPVLIVSILSILSYIGGIISYSLGRIIGNYRVFERIFTNIREQYASKIVRWGGLVIILAALTPIPFSPISMLSGSLRVKFSKYALYALTRLIRIAGYGLFFYLADHYF